MGTVPDDKGKGVGLLMGLAMKRPMSGSMPKEEPSPSDMTLENEPDADEDDAHGAAFDSFAKAAGIPAESQARAQAALKTFVRACMREYGSGG